MNWLKSWVVVVTLLMAGGCTLPKHIGDAFEVPKRQKEALPVSLLPTVIDTQGISSRVINPAEFSKIVVLARYAAESSPPPNNGWASAVVRYTMDPQIKHLLQVTLQKSLLSKGYRAASRLNEHPVLVEAAPLTDAEFARIVRGLFKGELLVLLTVDYVNMKDVEYVKTVWDGTTRVPIGTQVQAQVSLELVGMNAETYWVGTAKMDHLVRNPVTSLQVMEVLTHEIAKKLPEKQ